jgi:ABC-type nickel/cobalt efflux system permease component RcnA
MISTLLAGLLVGAVHAITGPDHMAAVIPLSLTDRRRGLFTGLSWGAGHGTGIAILTLIAVLLRDMLHVEIVGSWSEALVGVVLIGMGLWIATRSGRPERLHSFHLDGHTHTHTHPGGVVHTHAHAHPHEHVQGRPIGAAFGVGTLHGTAGMGHLVGVIPAMGMAAPNALVYLAALVAGAAFMMGGVGAVAGTVSARATPRWRRGLAVAAGSAAVIVGLFWLVTALPALT